MPIPRRLAIPLFLTLTLPAYAAIPDLKPTDPPSLAILVNNTKLPLAPVETRSGDLQAKAPANYDDHFQSWDPWPGNVPKGAPPNYIALSPKKDDNGTLILGGLFRAFDPASLTVKSADGKILKMDLDYKFNPHWAQISNLNNGLGKPAEADLTITYTYALQRLDLLETTAHGTPKIKTGKSVQLCPELPTPDENCTPLAGIYIAPWKEGDSYAVTTADLFPIEKVVPVAPINPAGIATFKKKLENGDSVKIAFCGDSITLGAESGNWWDNMWTDKNASYASRVLTALKTKYPKATITPIAAFQGATTTKAAMGLLEKALTTEKPDLVIVAFGMNDAAGPVGGKPNNPPEAYKADILALIQKIKENHAEVLLVTPFEGNPFLQNQMAQRLPDYRKVLLELSKEQNVACADVYTEWMNQSKLGTPAFSQVHNWINHPGPNGHALYARVILRFFESDTSPPPVMTQPADSAKTWEYKPISLPPIADILKNAKPNPFIYGVYCWTGEYKANLDAIHKIGWRSFRIGGPFDDEAMKLLVTDDIQIMPTLAPGKWQKDDLNKIEDSDYLKNYTTKLADFAKRYGPNGTFFKDNPTLPVHPIESIEICNEPNFQYLIPPDGRPGPELEKDRELLYSKLLPAAYTAIKAANPAMKVIGFGAGGAGAGDMRFIQHVHDNNPAVVKSYDVLSTHPYVTPAPPECFAIHPWGEYSTASSLQTIRTTIESAGRKDTPIWYTEVGWPISQADGGFYKTDRDTVTREFQAAYVCRLYALAQRLGVQRVDIMFLTDTDQFNAGFIQRDNSWRPSAYAVQNMIKLMPAPKLTAALADGEGGTFIYQFDSGDKTNSAVIMAWNVAGPKTVEIETGKLKGQSIDMLGHSAPITSESTQWTTKIGPFPTYLRPE